MAESFIVTNMASAVMARLHPAVTRWNRLEGRPRTHNFDRALRAELRDALWMLTRQWQMGEFQGDDAGSPVLARACLDLMPIERFQAGDGPVEALPREEPLEARVERRPLPLRAGRQYLSLDLRLLVGRRFLKLLAREAAKPAPEGLSADYRVAYIGQYPVPPPDPAAKADAAVAAHPEAWQAASAASGRAMDGIALLEHIADPAHQAFDGIGAAADDEPKLAVLAERLRAWFAALIAPPPADGNDAWQPPRLEYRFGVSACDGARELVLRAEEYHHGHLDWYVLERHPDEARLGEPPAPPRAPERRVHTFLPASIVFEGMPDTRHWAFEDRRTNFGEVKPDTTDLGKLLLLEFGLVYANDWFVLPYTLPVGTVAEVKGIALANVFGERLWIEPLRERPQPGWERFALFTPGAAQAEPRPAPPCLVLLPTVPKIQESRALEEVALIRDEMANMVWGIERRVPLPSGAAKPGAEAAHELRAHLERLVGAPPPAATPPVAPVRYQVMTTVPENWIPFIPVHVDGSVRETQLQRAALPRLIEGDPDPPEKVRPRTTLLHQNLPRAYFVFEEEVPRAGAVVRQTYQRTRWLGGRVFLWLGAEKATGRGEGWSGLAYDELSDSR